MTHTPEVLTLTGRSPQAARIRTFKLEGHEPGTFVSYPGYQTVKNAIEVARELQIEEDNYGNPENIVFQVIVEGEVVCQTMTPEMKQEAMCVLR